MSRRARPGRPARAQAASFGALVVLALAAALLLPGQHRTGGPASSPLPLIPAPNSVIGTRTPPPPPPPAGPSPAELARARVAARRFLAGYLPYLYGRAPARRVTNLTASVAASLRRSRARVTPAQRRRHPRLVALMLIGQTPGSVIATARVADGGVAPYPLTFTLQRSGRGEWVVADLGND